MTLGLEGDACRVPREAVRRVPAPVRCGARPLLVRLRWVHWHRLTRPLPRRPSPGRVRAACMHGAAPAIGARKLRREWARRRHGGGGEQRWRRRGTRRRGRRDHGQGAAAVGGVAAFISRPTT